MSTRRTSLNIPRATDTRTGPHPAGLRRARFGKWATWGAVCLAIASVAGRKGGIGGKGGESIPQPKPAPAAAAATQLLTKTMALDALIDALAFNRSTAADKTLEQIVTGEIPFGAHSKQASQAAMLAFALQPSPSRDAFLLRIFSDSDDAIRSGDQTAYPAADLRADTAHVLARVGSPSLRLSLAKLYTQASTSPAVRTAIESIIRAPSTANFAAQLELFRSPETPESLKAKLQKLLMDKNEAGLKLALKIEPTAPQPAAAAGGFPFSPAAAKPAAPQGASGLFAAAASLFGGGKASGAPAAKPGLPFGAAGGSAAVSQADMAKTMAALQQGMAAANAARGMKPGQMAPSATPAMLAVEMVGQVQSQVPIDPGLVAHDLWNAEFVQAITGKLAGNNGDVTAVASALGSLPTRFAREKLKDLLHKERTKGPQDFGKVETVTTPAGTPAGPSGFSGMRRRGSKKNDEAGAFGPMAQKPLGGGFGIGARKASPTLGTQAVVEFGKDWYDPGSLVVLKSVVPYAERPPEKPGHHMNYQQQRSGRMSAGMEKRLHDREEKQKALEATYEWRDAIEKAIHQWDERLAAVAEAPPETASAQEKSSDADEKGGSDAAKSGKSVSLKSDASKSSASQSAASKAPAAAPSPSPSVALPFTLHSGGKIAKEYHARWPQDLAASFSSATPEPLTVDYVRLQGPGEFGKILVHYRSAITAISGAKGKVFKRNIENGAWLDAMQKDQTGNKTRSVDVVVTKEASDDDTKKSKDVELTVEILVVEIETPGPEPTSGHGKKESPETTSTTSP